MTLLKVDNLSYYYQDGSRKRIILDNVSLSFEQGVFYSIVGESGSGKTTFLSLISGLDAPKSGEVLFNNESIYEMGITSFRRHHVSIIFQDYNLVSYLNGLQNVQLAMHLSKQKESDSEALRLLLTLGIDEENAKRKVSKISGGERQRIAIARAIASKADIIVADEPTGNLDKATGELIIEEFKKLAHQYNKCVIVATHSSDVFEASDVIFTVNSTTHKLE